MNKGRFFFLSLAVAGCTATAYAMGRKTRHLEKRQFKKDLGTWEGEGGNPAQFLASDIPVVPTHCKTEE